jgi:hypothetical protein
MSSKKAAKPAHKCVVVGCQRKTEDNIVSYHEFPTNKDIYQQWCTALCIEGEKKGINSNYITYSSGYSTGSDLLIAYYMFFILLSPS